MSERAEAASAAAGNGVGPGGALAAGSLAPSAAIVRAGRLAAVSLPLLVFALAPAGLAHEARLALAIASFAIVSWMTQALDHALTGLIACYLFWALGAARFDDAFHGFASTTPWFLYGALLLGLMASKSGLARRIAYLVMRGVGHSYSRLLFGLVLSDFLLTFLVPSGIARVVLMAAVALGLIEAFGVGPGSNIGRGMFIILTYTATIFDKMIIAGAASITARGLIEKLGEVEVLWSRWLIAYLPCDLVTIFVAWKLTLWLYPPERKALPGGAAFLDQELARMGPWSALEKKTALLMAAAVGMWMTDFLHRVPSPLIGLGVGLAAALPVVGVLSQADVKKLNLLPIFFVAACMSVSHVLAETGALRALTGAMTGAVTPLLGNVWSSTLVLYWSAFVYHIFIGDEISMLATSLPVLMELARAQGLDALALGMVWTFAAGGKIFVYQSAVLVVGYSYGYFDGRDMLKVGLALTLVESAILLLLVPLYWPLIGV